MHVTSRTVAFRGHDTWTRTTTPGSPVEGALPVVVLHGGPSLGHDYLVGLEALAELGGRTVVHYDQLGCGRSTRLPDAPESMWTPELFVDELLAVTEALGLERYHLVGHAWGGMLATEVALAHPGAVASLSVLNASASMDLWVRGVGVLRRRLPEAVRRRLEGHEGDGTVDDPGYAAALDAFGREHFCRITPWPQGLTDSIAQLRADPTVYRTMVGNPYLVTGTLRDWSVVDRLGDVAVPSFVVEGEFDEVTPTTWAPYVEQIPDVRSLVVPGTSHCTHLEDPQAVLAALGEFTARHDG